jgi:hypothetical protein
MLHPAMVVGSTRLSREAEDSKAPRATMLLRPIMRLVRQIAPSCLRVVG